MLIWMPDDDKRGKVSPAVEAFIAIAGGVAIATIAVLLAWPVLPLVGQ